MNEITKVSIYELCKKYDPVIIIDVYNHVFKFHFAHKDLSITTEDGITYLTGHLYGFTRNILYLKEKFPNCGIVLCIDGVDLERRSIYPEYKAHREHDINPADDMNVLLGLCSLVDGVYSCYDPNYEADDAVASVVRTIKYLCNKFSIKKQIYMLSSDKDWWQLIDDATDSYCAVASVKKWGLGDKWLTDAEIVTESVVKETFNGTSPENLLKFRAITGDSSDNIKGYLRYYKKNAAIIAENFNYDLDANTLTLKDGVDMRESWVKFLKVLTDDMSIFKRNYQVMSLKSFDFTLEPIFKNVSSDRIVQLAQAMEKLRLSYYAANVRKISAYSEQLNKYFEENTSMDAELEVQTIGESLEDLL